MYLVFFRPKDAKPGDIELEEVDGPVGVGLSKIRQDVVEEAQPVLTVLEEDICNLCRWKCLEKNSVIGDDDDDYTNRWLQQKDPARLVPLYPILDIPVSDFNALRSVIYGWIGKMPKFKEIIFPSIRQRFCIHLSFMDVTSRP